MRERDTIRQVFGVPPEQMGVVENSNRATIDVSDYIYQSRVIVTRVEFLCTLFQQRLVPMFNDERLIIGYVNPVKEDREFLLKVRTASSWASTVDEWREMRGLEPLPAGRGRIHMIPFSTTPARLDCSTLFASMR